MRTISIFLLTVAVFVLNSFYTPAHAQELKIGAVDAMQVIERSPQTIELQEQLQDEFSERQKELISDREKLKEMEERLQRDGMIMSETERQNLQDKIIDLQRELKRNQDEFREDLTFRRNTEISQIQQEITQAIRDFARQNKYDLIISQGVLFASDKADITGLVIDYLRKKTDKET